jgi:lysophospholipase L1-like esterase
MSESVPLSSESLARLGYPGRSRGLTVIPFGDSITANNASHSSSLEQFGVGYAETSLFRAGPRFRMIRNAGVSGDTLAMMEARLSADVLAYNPDICLFLGGTNNYVFGMANSAYATMMNTHERIIKKVLRARILPIVVVPPPKGGAALESRIGRMFYYSLAHYYALPLLDMYALGADPTGGGYISGYSGDGTHPGPTFIDVVGTAFAAQLQHLGDLGPGLYMSVYSETATGAMQNLLRNGNFARQQTPPTPDSWTVNTTNATVTGPSVAAPTSLPVLNGITFTHDKAATGLQLPLTGAFVSTGFSPGDKLAFSGRIKSTGLTPASATGFSIRLDMSGGGLSSPVTSCPQNADITFCQELIVPAGTTTITPKMVSNDICKLEVNNLTLINLTARDAIWRPGLQ